jgi:phosphopantothenoylcysteine decarboxylase/phosphopantothenate--cysteine ligase
VTGTRPTPVVETGTSLLRTAVLRAPDGGLRLRRAPGQRAPREFVPVDPALHERLAAIRTPQGARLALSEANGPVRLYPVDGADSVAKRLLLGGPRAELIPPAHALGGLLRAVHELDPPPGLLARPARGVERLSRWLAGRSVDAYAAYAAEEIRRHLGPERWAAVHARFTRLVEEEEPVLAHGAAGLGSMIVGETGADALLIGEDLCLASWRLDVAWVIGEFVELRWQLGGDQQAWQALLDAFFEGYGRNLGDEWPQLAALRILLHVHDIAAYADWYRAGFDHYAGFLKFLLDL